MWHLRFYCLPFFQRFKPARYSLSAKSIAEKKYLKPISIFVSFLQVIEKAKKACNKSHYTVSDHFVEYHEMIDIGKGARREMPSVALSRYA